MSYEITGKVKRYEKNPKGFLSLYLEVVDGSFTSTIPFSVSDKSTAKEKIPALVGKDATVTFKISGSKDGEYPRVGFWNIKPADSDLPF